MITALGLLSACLASGCGGDAEAQSSTPGDGGQEASDDAGIDAPALDSTVDVGSDADGSLDAEPDVSKDADAPLDAKADGTMDATDADDAGDGATLTCHGRSDLCDRPYNQVAQVCTHNAMSSTAYSFIVPTPNQARSFTEQLDDGVRCLMLDTYAWQGDLYLCHGECGFWGALPLVDGLVEIATWMDAHPSEVVTFILEAYISEADTFSALVDAGLADPSGEPTTQDVLYYHDAPPGSPWPTLREMEESGQRLVVFTDDGSANGNWHLDWRAYGWETPWDDPTFSCQDNRGDPTAYDNQVFILNHFTISSIGGSEQLSEQNNAFDVLWDHASRCWQTDAQYNPWQQIPTFVTVDHYHLPTTGGATLEPDAFDVVEALNDAWPTAPAL